MPSFLLLPRPLLRPRLPVSPHYQLCRLRTSSPRPQFRNAPFQQPPRHKLPKILSLFIAVSGLIYGVTTLHATPQPTTLNPQTFIPFTITAKIPITTSSPQTAIFSLDPSVPSKLPYESGILSVQIKQPQLQIARSYTPLPEGIGATDGRISFLVRNEPGGEMSRYLFSLHEGDVVFLRGPALEYMYPTGEGAEGRKILFIAGGTGIAPALQAAVNAPVGKVQVLWAVRNRAETQGPVTKEVWQAVEGGKGKVEVKIFVDGENGIVDEDIARGMEGEGVTVIVSGPDGFVRWVAGEKEWRQGKEEQGELGGIVRKVLEERGGEVEVFKL